MKRVHSILVSLLLASTTGCIPLVYAYPSISFIPEINVGHDSKLIYAFRVDITEDSSEAGHYQFRRLPMTPNGYVSGQEKTALDDGYCWNCIGFKHERQIHHTLRERLYRRGYEVIDVHSWQGTQPVIWKEISGTSEEEKAIDALLAPIHAASSKEADGTQFLHLEPGSVSPQHQDSLRFAAAEYEYLAKKLEALGEDNDDAYDRCRAKARALRDLASR
jgi:hypothetical protein